MAEAKNSQAFAASVAEPLRGCAGQPCALRTALHTCSICLHSPLLRHRRYFEPLAVLEASVSIVSGCADTYVPEPPCCTYGLCVPAVCVLYAPEAQGRCPREGTASLGRAVRSPYRGTPQVSGVLIWMGIWDL